MRGDLRSLRDGARQEMLRNEVLMLLVNLVKEVHTFSQHTVYSSVHAKFQNDELQKIAAFNGAFERLFDIVDEEEHQVCVTCRYIAAQCTGCRV